MEQGDSLLAFGAVRGLALDENGFLYVLDGQVPTIRVFDSTGVHVQNIGREGEGPGEFMNPGGLVLSSDGLLWVRDYPTRRYTAFRPDGEIVGTYRRNFGGLLWRASPGPDGEIRESVSLRVDGTGNPVPAVLHLAPSGSEMLAKDTTLIPDALVVPQWEVEFREVEPGIAEGGQVPVPFAPEVMHALDPDGGVWFGRTDNFRFTRHDERRGRSLIIERINAEPKPVTDADLEAVITRLRERHGDALVVTRDLVPGRTPYWHSMSVDPEGYLWVERYEPDGETRPSTWELYEARQGRFLGTVNLPFTRGDGLVFGRNKVAGVVTGEADTQSVVVVELRR